jgi:glycosyltransferase involved in cell wall biosynthesis
MMDNSPITGGCHYPWDCQGYSINCEKCPALSNNAFNWLPELNLRFKKNWLPKNLLFIACSESDLNRGCKSILSKNKIEKIYLPVDSNKFFPSEKGLSKLYFNIPANKQVILYGSLNINEERKGGRLFIESLRLLERKLTLQQIDNIIILVAGNSSELEKSFFNNNTNFQIKYTGHLSEECLIKAYQAAQIFVSTSIEDSGPFMVNQALMCGTPVVAFKSGVAVDLCDSKIFGCIVDLYDVEKLSIGMLKFLKLNKEEYEMAAIHCRISAVEKFSFSSTIKRYESVLNLKDCEYKR